MTCYKIMYKGGKVKWVLSSALTSLLQYIHHQKIMKKVYVVYSLHLAELVAPLTSSYYRIYSNTMRGFFPKTAASKSTTLALYSRYSRRSTIRTCSVIQIAAQYRQCPHSVLRQPIFWTVSSAKLDTSDSIRSCWAHWMGPPLYLPAHWQEKVWPLRLSFNHDAPILEASRTVLGITASCSSTARGSRLRLRVMSGLRLLDRAFMFSLECLFFYVVLHLSRDVKQQITSSSTNDGLAVRADEHANENEASARRWQCGIPADALKTVWADVISNYFHQTGFTFAHCKWAQLCNIRA